MSSRETPLRRLLDWVAASGQKPTRADLNKIEFSEELDAGQEAAARAQIGAAAAAICTFHRDGSFGQARRMAAETADRLSHAIAEPEHTGTDTADMGPAELAALIPRSGGPSAHTPRQEN
jgi:hypothetical protein